MKNEDSQGGKQRCFGGGKAGLSFSFSSSVWILVLPLDTGAQPAYPGWRDLQHREKISGGYKNCTPQVQHTCAPHQPHRRRGYYRRGSRVAWCLLATIRGASTPTVGAAVPNTNNSERKCPKARKKVHSVMW